MSRTFCKLCHWISNHAWLFCCISLLMCMHCARIPLTLLLLKVPFVHACVRNQVSEFPGRGRLCLHLLTRPVACFVSLTWICWSTTLSATYHCSLQTHRYGDGITAASFRDYPCFDVTSYQMAGRLTFLFFFFSAHAFVLFLFCFLTKFVAQLTWLVPLLDEAFT